MVGLTQEGLRIVDDVSRRYGVSADAVRTVLEALVASGGGMAQFSHPDLGGMGQWSRGGMIMIGDMFNNGLKSRVDGICNELSEVVGRSNLVSERPYNSQWQSQNSNGSSNGMQPLPPNSLFVSGNAGSSGGNWWPADLGWPASSGAQNNMHYACFPDRRRLAIDIGGQVSVYDTGDHWISGFSQQQSGDQSLTFNSQYGVVRVDSLKLVSGTPPAPIFQQAPAYQPPESQPQGISASQPPAGQSGAQAAGQDIFASIERLAGLRDKGFISEQEFAAKKSDLLNRL